MGMRRDLIKAMHPESLIPHKPCGLFPAVIYRDCHNSEEATKLLLASQRHNSSKFNDSLFRKRASWCSKQDSDPISFPMGRWLKVTSDGHMGTVCILIHHPVISVFENVVAGNLIGQCNISHPPLSIITCLFAAVQVQQTVQVQNTTCRAVCACADLA